MKVEQDENKKISIFLIYTVSYFIFYNNFYINLLIDFFFHTLSLSFVNEINLI